jgi:outer membrane lipoprotein-sorting protein
MKKRILFSVAAIGLALFAGTASAQQLSLAQISQYLNGLQTAQGGFTQINQDGTLSTGTIYIKRPGRIRFDYAAPDNTLVIGGGGSLAIFDPRSNAGPER